MFSMGIMGIKMTELTTRPGAVGFDGGIINEGALHNKAAASGRWSDAEVYCATPVARRPRHGNAHTIIRL